MKLFILFVSATSLLINLSQQKISKRKHLRKHLTIDRQGLSAGLSHVVRRTPTVTYKESVSRIADPNASSTMAFSNSNTHNGGSFSFGKSAHIVNPRLVMHSKGTISVVQETPAHVGWRNEMQTVSSLNKKTNKVEKHIIENKVPLIGMVQQVKTLKTDSERSYDITQNTLGKMSTSITA